MSLPKQPNELLSRHWFHIWNETRHPDGVHDRIDSLRKRLDGLELRLRKFGASPNGRSNPIWQGVELSTVMWLGSYIGVWQIEAELPLSLEERSVIRMLYPHNTQVMTAWNVEIMGEPPNEEPGNKPCCLIMLSDEGVHYLNEVVHWLEMNEGTLV